MPRTLLTAVHHTPPPWMLVRLEVATRSHCEAADAERLALLDDTTPASYRRYLRTNHGLEAPFENAAARLIPLDARIIEACGHATKLRADLGAIGYTEDQIERLPRCDAIPDFKCTIQLLGWIYVFERSRLLHGLIRRHLVAHVPNEMVFAGAYLAAHDRGVGAHYRAVGEMLDEYANANAFAPSQIVRAAQDAFRIQRQWFAAHAERLAS